jgi:hypothetical protein
MDTDDLPVGQVEVMLHVEPSCYVSQRPLMVPLSGLNSPVKRCQFEERLEQVVAATGVSGAAIGSSMAAPGW